MFRPEVTALVFAVLGSSAGAQGLSDLATEIGRAVELPAHRTLVEMLDNSDPDLADFTTDGCSGGMSTVWAYIAENFPNFAEVHSNEPPWLACCTIHDKAYYSAGGAKTAEASFDARLKADETLRTCVADTALENAEALSKVYETDADAVAEAFSSIAGAMFHSVRLGGGPCSGLPWRWGYGYPQCPTIFD